MSDESSLTDRHKRAIYRAVHRGTKEMDWLLGRYVEAHVGGMDEGRLDRLDEFLQLPDPLLELWLMGRDEEIQKEFVGLVEDIRIYHKLG